MCAIAVPVELRVFVNGKKVIRIENYNKDFKKHVKEVQIMRSEHSLINNYKDYGFDYAPYLSKVYENKYSELVRAQNIVNERLKDYEDYGGVRFSDVSASGIQMTPVNNKTPISLASATIRYDFSNVDEAIDEAVRDFIKTDSEKEIKYANRFYEDGMKYGWD